MRRVREALDNVLSRVLLLDALVNLVDLESASDPTRASSRLTIAWSSPPEGKRARGTLIFSASSAAMNLRLASKLRVPHQVDSRRVDTGNSVELGDVLSGDKDLVTPASSDRSELDAVVLQLVDELADGIGLRADSSREAGEVSLSLLVAPCCQLHGRHCVNGTYSSVPENMSGVA